MTNNTSILISPETNKITRKDRIVSNPSFQDFGGLGLIKRVEIWREKGRVSSDLCVNLWPSNGSAPR